MLRSLRKPHTRGNALGRSVLILWSAFLYFSRVHLFFFVSALRLSPVFIRASRLLPSTPPLSQRVERHFFEGQFGGFSVSGIHYNNLPHVRSLPTVAAEADHRGAV